VKPDPGPGGGWRPWLTDRLLLKRERKRERERERERETERERERKREREKEKRRERESERERERERKTDRKKEREREKERENDKLHSAQRRRIFIDNSRTSVALALSYTIFFGNERNILQYMYLQIQLILLRIMQLNDADALLK
jgi:cation transport ATPase